MPVGVVAGAVSSSGIGAYLPTQRFEQQGSPFS